MIFLDTNIFVYAKTDDLKAPRARFELAARGWISVQILSEFTNVMRNKLRQPWDYIDSALQDIHDVVRGVVALTPEVQAAAYALAKNDGIGIYDGLVVAAAQSVGCRELVTEDLQHGRRFSDLVVRNPFR
ncbi:MAG: PIN domain-containing protein [Alphaproteobacteria bacterium]|nr:PIN domain-containing protein [Alphaproteobacteria bacterium]